MYFICWNRLVTRSPVKSAKGNLFLIPTPITDGKPELQLSQEVKESVTQCHIFLVENIRSATRFLSSYLDKETMHNVVIEEITNELSDDEVLQMLLPLTEGTHAGILSEAGMPCIADPGARIVSMAHTIGIAVRPLAGPSSIFMALVASGFNGQQFVFHGYLPRDSGQRRQAIFHIEKDSPHRGYTQICMETPYRNMALFEDLIRILKPNTLLCVAAGLGGKNSFIRTKSVSEWKSSSPPIQKIPCIFLILASHKQVPNKHTRRK